MKDNGLNVAEMFVAIEILYCHTRSVLLLLR